MNESWGELILDNDSKIEALEARVVLLEERVDSLLEYIHEMKVIQPTYSGGLVPRNRIR